MKRLSWPQNVWVLIPAYNEAKYLNTVLQKVRLFSPNIVVVDDGSQDKTTREAQKGATYTLTHKVNLGKGAALKTGCEFIFNHLHGSAVIMMDADDQHDPAELPLFIRELKKKEQMVLGIREVDRNMPFLRSLSNKVASSLVELIFGRYVPDIPSGYKAFTKKAYQKLRWNSTDYAVELEIAARTARYKIDFSTVCIRTIYHDMNKGMTMLDVLTMLRQLLNWKFTL